MLVESPLIGGNCCELPDIHIESLRNSQYMLFSVQCPVFFDQEEETRYLAAGRELWWPKG